MSYEPTLQKILYDDPLRNRVLSMVFSLGLPDCWVGAGFIRNAFWDFLHARQFSCHPGDVDVLWFSKHAERSEDQKLESMLYNLDPSIKWSVKNQARMHLRNGDKPYASTVEAIGYWPETATAIAARQREEGYYEIAAPFGLDDLFNLVLKPTPLFLTERRQIYLNRVQTKGWLKAWPLLRMEGG
jgi:hypothetical protein